MPDLKQRTSRPREQTLSRLWQNAHVLSEGILTQDGRRFRVVYPGRASGMAGPDFRDCLVVTDTGELLSGDVELHVEAPDWERHKHHLDPNYNGVILHVVLYPKDRRATDQQSGMKAPVVTLGLATDRLRCARGLCLGGPTWRRGLDKECLGQVLDHAGDQRFLGRSKGFALDMGGSEPEESLYRALLESLGYTANRKPFRELAKTVPMSKLRALRREPQSTRQMAITAVLINAAGLLPWVRPLDEEVLRRSLLKHLPRTAGMAADAWRLHRVRPANHPVRRVIGAAHLVERYIESGLVRGLEEDVRRCNAGFLVQRLAVSPFIGRGRAREMAASVVLPFLHALAGIRRDLSLRRECLELYRGFPRLEDNEVTREMKRLLSQEGEALEITGARRQQGLIQLYRTMKRRVAA